MRIETVRVVPIFAAPRRKLPNGQVIERGIPCEVRADWAELLVSRGVVRLADTKAEEEAPPIAEDPSEE
jgi:hypothetical protein